MQVHISTVYSIKRAREKKTINQKKKVICEIQNVNEKTMKERRKKLLDINKHRDKNIYIVSVFNCMEYIIVDCMLELVIHHFSLQLNIIIQKMNNYLSIQWNLSNPTHQGTREICRIVQDVGKLRFSFQLTEICLILTREEIVYV